ncbi:hypothetical protein [Atopobium sp. oral taxon 416]|uniref:hypothetical protein n=1 Tax=Atopobium sp. oral taxon 416 TaxID=712157 RepID=UPI001BABB455|nr:hypothetical protein [Atopobium sp. oral taxon 416]QUC02753.1 hypothetical protein J4859_12135 [Atopobium sp. oral taxon 416]
MAWHGADPASAVAVTHRRRGVRPRLRRPAGHTQQGRFEGARRIGIDKTSYKKGHKYLIVVVGHDRGCLIWAHEGYGKDVLGLFLDELT